MELMRGNRYPTSLVTKFVIMAGTFEFLGVSLLEILWYFHRKECTELYQESIFP